jgi:hypothetical protein
MKTFDFRSWAAEASCYVQPAHSESQPQLCMSRSYYEPNAKVVPTHQKQALSIELLSDQERFVAVFVTGPLVWSFAI